MSENLYSFFFLKSYISHFPHGLYFMVFICEIIFMVISSFLGNSVQLYISMGSTSVFLPMCTSNNKIYVHKYLY